MNNSEINPQLIYQSLLAETDKEAQEDYFVDPRVAQYAMRNAGCNDVGVYAHRHQMYADIAEATENKIVIQPSTEIDSLAVPVQDQPQMVDSKTIVIVDTAQRDWTVQPDAYSNVFSFTTQDSSTYSANQVIPYYYNNSNVPLASYDYNYPSSSMMFPQINFLPNNKPKTIDPATGGIITLNTQWQNQGLLANVWGWRLVYDGITGALKKFPAPINPNDRVVYFPVYNPAESRGSIIGSDVFSNWGTQSAAGTFGTQLQLSNVKNMKLARATLPVRRFDAYNTDIFVDKTFGLASNSAMLLNTFHAEPYILMSISNMQGQYYGAAQCVQQSFAALVQQQRSVFDATAGAYLAQFQDYYPWSDEAYKYDPPLSQLSNINITLSNHNGKRFSHLDDLNAITVFFGTSATAAPISNQQAKGVGTLNFLVTRDITQPYTDLLPPNTANVFSPSDVRPGDEITMYKPMITRMQNDPSCSPLLSNFLNSFASNNLLVTKVYYFTGLPNVPLLDVAVSFDAIVKTTTFNETLTYYEGLNSLLSGGTVLPTMSGMSAYADLSSLDGFQYLSLASNNRITFFDSSAGMSTINLSDTFGAPSYSYPTPMMNLNMQCTYAFEVTTTTADTAQLSKIIPN
jgi:hypothetical protein